MLTNCPALTFQEKTISQTAFPRLFPVRFRRLLLCIGPALVTVMLLGSSKSFPLSANARQSIPWLGKKKFFLKKLYGQYNLLKHLVEEFSLEDNSSKHQPILFDMVLAQENVLDVSLFVYFP